MSDDGRSQTAALPDVSRETLARLDILVSDLQRWSRAHNLVGRGELATVWRRHVLDSAQLFALAPTTAHRWADLGTGAGFPGLVITAIAADRRPDMSVTLVEADRRKAAFLAHAGARMGLRPDIRSERIETLAPLAADIVSARALAPLSELLGYCARHLRPGGLALLPKGARVDEELTRARRCWHMREARVGSMADTRGAVLILSEIRRVEDRPSPRPGP